MNDNLPNSPEASDPLDALLRESAVHLPDDGFTARVLTSLPPRRRYDGLRLAVFAAAWLAGVLVLLRHAPAASTAVTAFLQHAQHGEVAALLALAPVVIVICSLIWALASWALEEWV
jgi:hypothetical protein